MFPSVLAMANNIWRCYPWVGWTKFSYGSKPWAICYGTSFPLQQRLGQNLFPVAACLMSRNSSSKDKVSFFLWSQSSETPRKLMPTSCHRMGKKKSVLLMHLTWAKRTIFFLIKVFAVHVRTNVSTKATDCQKEQKAMNSTSMTQYQSY